tara:strand:+ start:7877 stop:8227 length:351 start_codon:yes stop_codon:yes gene_type:complete
MRSELLVKVADVLDAFADKIDCLEAEKQASAVEAKKKIIEPVLDKLALVTGQDHSSLEEKLSSANPDVLAMLAKFAGSDEMTELGGPGTEKVAFGSSSKQEKAAAAEDNFLGWIVS